MSFKNCLQDISSVKTLAFDLVMCREVQNISQIYSILSKDESNTKRITQMTKTDLLGVFVMVVKNIENYKLNEDCKILIMKIVSITLAHNTLGEYEKTFFYNLFGTLVQEVLAVDTCSLKDSSEEYRWEVLIALHCLFEAATPELCFQIYTKEHALKICKGIYILREILKYKCRKLRTEALKCLMSIYRVGKNTDILSHPELAEAIANCLAFFLPGISSTLASIALEGDRAGRKILQLTIDAVGRITTLVMATHRKETLRSAKEIFLQRMKQLNTVEPVKTSNHLKTFKKMEKAHDRHEEYDEKLAQVFTTFIPLTSHESDEVRLHLAEMCNLLIKYCFENLKKSTYPLVEMLVALSNDDNLRISKLCKSVFELPGLGQNVHNVLLDQFYKNYSKIPTVFNGLDVNQQIHVLKITGCTLELVGNRIQYSTSFKEFMRIMLYLCEIEVDTSNFSEVISHEDLDSEQPILVDLWKNFKYMEVKQVRDNFQEICRILYENDLFPVVSDYLINIISQKDEKVEAFFLLNQFLLGYIEVFSSKSFNLLQKQNRFPYRSTTQSQGIDWILPMPKNGLFDLMMPVFQCYMDNWDIPLQFDEDECTSLKTLRHNVLEAALLCEGTGLMAYHLTISSYSRPFLHQCLYKVLVRSASSHCQIQAAAAQALRNMAKGLFYPTVSELLNQNMDFFLFNIECGLKWTDGKEEVFQVMEMVMKYGDVSILQHFISFMKDVLVQIFDRFNRSRIDCYLRMFKIFLKSLIRWFGITVPERVFKTKQEKLDDQMKNFKIGGLDDEFQEDGFSDNIMGKTAEEMYKEDMEKKAAELKEEYIEPKEEEYKKPEVPRHIQITVEILKRSLHFLPSKDANRKLLALEILRNGVEIIRDYEDEMLPVVHLIWSPLVDRFKEIESPVILNSSFRLLLVMARVSKDFIRNRTAKDVLPSLLTILTESSKKSYLKDRGSAYRYSLDFKLQLLMLENFVYLVTDIELVENDIEKTMKSILLYLSKNQPFPLQTEAVKFFKLMIKYDPVFEKKITPLLVTSGIEFEKNLKVVLNCE